MCDPPLFLDAHNSRCALISISFGKTIKLMKRKATFKIQKGAWIFFEVLQRLMRNKDGEILGQILI